MNSLCIYHGGCTDGIASAYAVWRARKDFAYYPGVYQQEPPWDQVEVAKCVYFVDFSYKQDVMREVARRCPGEVTVLDHHETARDCLEPLFADRTLRGEFDMDRCGALITWDWFHSPNNRLPLLEHIDARDRWVNPRPPGNDEIIMALRSYSHHHDELELWDELMHPSALEGLETEGRAIMRYYRQRVDEAKRAATQWTLGSVGMPVVNASFALASDVAGELAAEHDGVAAVWWANADGTITFSMRARGDFHAGRFCETFAGGGGHAGAAGFKVPASYVDVERRHCMGIAGKAESSQ